MLTQEMALKVLETGQTVTVIGRWDQYRVSKVESKGTRWWKLTIESLQTGNVLTFTNRVTDGVSNLYLT